MAAKWGMWTGLPARQDTGITCAAEKDEADEGGAEDESVEEGESSECES
jgi:hypothetical protein